ncbi:AI-2E family transporter [Paenibacillus apiarius]|uniref:AI-2E family transporter n=1 Tax=Paenibacillus apiarius TaxID=46240 RepID=A0ABT4E5C9_9BACL|nr:AI-2E family transporter [Paenibacillus apiarius]MCY9517957.1 AI-2E family transporter [Paenibacillus apiarius]MCY9523558.1 AI-2E family transporter [Paenibacillus apiarius]MCY9555415.1 AI-2E family transporter [Paenibacillus apiarius]MCY9561489.1 AI-2E family transporter [Paenibacillus apiarius]MCY9684280.1 AI-2E family transporter [Paenibacillus apiarius]
MERPPSRPTKFRMFFLNNKFVLFLLIMLLIGLNIFVLTKISFVFDPLLILIKTVLLPVLLAGVLYYLLNPIVDYLEKKKVKRLFSILILYILILGIITIVVLAVIPVIRRQISDLIANFPVFSAQIQTLFTDLIGSDFINRFQQTINFDTSNLMNTISERVSTLLNSTWTGIGGFLGAVTETVLTLVTVPFILFYLLKDGKRLPHYILSFIPNSLRKQSDQVMTEMNHQISSYIRGQIIVSFCIGILLYIGYLIIGLEYSLILAVIAACTSIVPYLGPAIAITPALIVALVTSPVMLLKMIVVWTVVQLVEGKFISPQIMGKTLQIHPITIIFVILTAGNLFGLLGIVLAVPGYAVLKVIVTHLFNWFKERSHLYERDHM